MRNSISDISAKYEEIPDLDLKRQALFDLSRIKPYKRTQLWLSFCGKKNVPLSQISNTSIYKKNLNNFYKNLMYLFVNGDNNIRAKFQNNVAKETFCKYPPMSLAELNWILEEDRMIMEDQK